MKFALALLLTFIAPHAFAADKADHECKIFLNSASWTPHASSFALAVQIPAYMQPNVRAVKMMVNFRNNGWEEITIAPVDRETAPEFRHYSTTYHVAAGGHRAMTFDFIPFVELTNGDRLFDHNWHDGDDGHMRLDASNRWLIYGQPDHCMQQGITN